MGSDRAVAAVSLSVRRSLAGVAYLGLVLAACSGGPDSLAMAAALAFEAPRLGLRAGAVTVDHGLQPGSAEQAARAAATLHERGLEPVHSLRAEVAVRRNVTDYPGPEAAARRARYDAIEAAAVECGATAVMLGHTMDDQAETVLLGLARGSGARSLAGMRTVSGRYLRPMLGLRRAPARAARSALCLGPWRDPPKTQPAHARTRAGEQRRPRGGFPDTLARGDTERQRGGLADTLAPGNTERQRGGFGRHARSGNTERRPCWTPATWVRSCSRC